MKRCIIFDCNGLFLKFQHKLSVRFCRDFNIALELFIPAQIEIMNNVRRPNAPDLFSLWLPYFENWKVSFDKESFLRYWFDSEIEVPKMFDLIKELKSAGNKVFILSNNFRERYEYKKDFFDRLNSLCDGVYYSWNTGFVKPHPNAFGLVLATQNIMPDECLFFDDDPRNVIAAEDIGIESYVFKDYYFCRALLLEKGLLV